MRLKILPNPPLISLHVSGHRKHQMGILALDSRAYPTYDPPAVGSRPHPTVLDLSSPPPPYKSHTLSLSFPSSFHLGFIAPPPLNPNRRSVSPVPSRFPTVGMNSFDSTFEALALHYVGFGLFTVVNNVWTIVALVTAALSFWRLRAASLPLPLPSDRRLESSSHEALDSSPSCSPIPESADEATGTTPTHPSPNVPAAPPACDADIATKGRFFTYYREEGRGDAVDNEEEAELSGGRRWLGDRAGEWWEGWEKALRLRSNGGESGRGWYDYQDRAVLSGSVVRLWEEEERWELVAGSSVTSAGRCCVLVW